MAKQEEPEKNNSEGLNKAVDLLAETANHIMDTVSWFAKTLHSSGNVFKIEDARGATAEVSLSIPKGGAGEVCLRLGQTRKHYPAQAANPDEEFRRGAIVRVKDVGVNTMFVESPEQSI